ncbi:ParB/RepB/Spo0J family partition protein [Zooshikella sp. RANM57]|uniref:ParB/RepB/Spo0J family partition protein n=1 Tax=Zooshikella sp. RANM57 TaxID=3425863 RepID=UPI003D6E6448
MGNSFSDMLKRNKSKNDSGVNINSLLEDTGTDSIIGKAKKEGRYLELTPQQLEPDPNQPRKTFDEHTLKELQLSIETRGQLQPILVGNQNGKGKYPIISGERRWRAISNSTIVTTISAVIRSGSSDELLLLLIQIDENNKREQVPAIENAEAMKRVVEICKSKKLDQAYAASVLGMSKAALSKHLSLLKAPESIKQLSLNNETQDVETLYNLSRAAKKNEKLVSKLVDKWKGGKLKKTLRVASKELLDDSKQSIDGKLPSKLTKIEKVKRVFIEEGQPPKLVIEIGDKAISYSLPPKVLEELKHSLQIETE